MSPLSKSAVSTVRSLGSCSRVAAAVISGGVRPRPMAGIPGIQRYPVQDTRIVYLVGSRIPSLDGIPPRPGPSSALLGIRDPWQEKFVVGAMEVTHTKMAKTTDGCQMPV